MKQTIAERILQRRYQMLVHSYLYYQRDASYIADETFDRWARELVKLHTDHPDVAATVKYHKEFRTFDGTTGYDLPFTLPEIQAIGDQLLKYRSENDVR